MTDIIEVQLVNRASGRARSATVAAATPKGLILAEAETDDGTFRVCERCLKAGQDKLDARLEESAQRWR